MKKIFSKVLGFVGALVITFSLASCGVNQKAADKINAAASKKENYTVEQLEKSYGDPTFDYTIAQNGLLVWVNGCKDADDVSAKYDNGKSLEALYVVVVLGKATSASYEKYDPNKKK